MALGLVWTMIAPAGADYRGAWRYPYGNPSFPLSCVDAGTTIRTNFQPDKHNATASNACGAALKVKVTQIQIDGNGVLHAYCSVGFVADRATCVEQSGAVPFDHWEWTVSNQQDGGGWSCQESTTGYGACYQSDD